MKDILKDIKNYKLCYVDNINDYSILELYFTELDDVTKQWGDDWDDTPYEHNAEPPYEYDYSQPEQGVKDGVGIYPKIDIYKLFIVVRSWKVDVLTPCSGTINSRYSVEDINKRIVPWLTIVNEKENLKDFIHAGTTIKEFIKIMKKYEDDIDVYYKYDLG